jgi:hypothetical protein
MSPTKPKLLPALLIAAVVALTACSGHSNPYRDQYLKVIAPANAAVAVFRAQEQALPSSATGPAAAKIADPLAAAIRDSDRKLLRASWPANVLPDIKRFTTAASLVVRDLEQVATKQPFTVTAWKSQLDKDERKLLGRASIVRADLGLRNG